MRLETLFYEKQGIDKPIQTTSCKIKDDNSPTQGEAKHICKNIISNSKGKIITKK